MRFPLIKAKRPLIRITPCLLGILMCCTQLVAIGAGATELVVPDAPLCPKRAMLEKLLYRKVKFPNENFDLAQAKAGTTCMLAPLFTRVWAVVQVQKSSMVYSCFRLWDATLPLPPTGKEQEFCSPSNSVVPLAQVVKARTGDYTITHRTAYELESAEYIRAECHELGSVSLKRQGSTWWRNSILPFDSPSKGGWDEPIEEGPVESLLRLGCKGQDYE